MEDNFLPRKPYLTSIKQNKQWREKMRPIRNDLLNNISGGAGAPVTPANQIGAAMIVGAAAGIAGGPIGVAGGAIAAGTTMAIGLMTPKGPLFGSDGNSGSGNSGNSGGGSSGINSSNGGFERIDRYDDR